MMYTIYLASNWYFNSPLLISEKKFTKDIISNTTKIDMYGNNEVYIYTNKLHQPNFYFDTHDKDKLIEKLDILNYENEFYYNHSKPFSIFDYSLFIFYVLFYILLQK